jgi:hypothetical protein
MWANAGACQIHLPVAREPQIVDGAVTLEVPDRAALLQRLHDAQRKDLFVAPASAFTFRVGSGSSGEREDDDDDIHITCPYGNRFVVPSRQFATPTPHRLGIRSVEVCWVWFLWPGNLLQLYETKYKIKKIKQTRSVCAPARLRGSRGSTRIFSLRQSPLRHQASRACALLFS